MYPCSSCEDNTQLSTQSRLRTSDVEAKGQDDQEIVVDAKVKAMWVDGTSPPSRRKMTFVQLGPSWAAATFRGSRAGRADSVSSVPASTMLFEGFDPRYGPIYWVPTSSRPLYYSIRDKATTDPSSQWTSSTLGPTACDDRGREE